MESSEAAARRISCISRHLAANYSNSCPSSLTSMVCSSSSGVQPGGRKDSRLLFARQDIHCPALVTEPDDCQVPNPSQVYQAVGRKDSRVLFARQAIDAQGYFMREYMGNQLTYWNEAEGGEQDECADEKHCISELGSTTGNHSENKPTNLDGEPKFARTADEGHELANIEQHNLPFPVDDAKQKVDWLPRMDVAEFAAAYLVTIELPGVQVDGIRVEVNEERLLVSGSRPSTECPTDGVEQGGKAFYHCKELSQGSFRAQWPLPKNTNVDAVSAEFMDGFLRVFLPKHRN
ncbi:hypothetical protein KP509_05G035700 [Ceratopteris richardii]|uniref:SHSP domain-containing protein n=1 Tax=Ceratopteris richardii TaxID=49495 RepID=A0A8T2UKU9_CERRI|nr:hypothetical protein KP509_05G035700 [Ceratopteris richardii]KAH7436778.1 hypothetical protein KP509_05G035700 [Ceratopteris richardii]